MKNHTQTLVLVSGTLLLGILASLPTASATACDGTEGFEDDTVFQSPSGCWYTTSNMGSSAVSTTRFNGGAKSLGVPAVLATTPTFTFVPAQYACQDGQPFAASWFFNLDTLPAGGHEFRMGFGAITPASSSVYVYISSAGAIAISSDSAPVATFSGLTIAADTWYGVELHISCLTGSSNDDTWGSAWLASNRAGTEAGAPISDVSLTSGGSVYGNLQFAFSGGAVPAYWLDDLSITYDNTLTSFCADPNVINYDGNPATPTTTTGASDDYGYNYRRGGSFFDQSEGANPEGIGLSTGFDYTGTSNSESQWDYSAKSFLVGTKALHENITIEADSQSQSVSNWRVNFHTQSSGNPDDTYKGNGLTTGHFSDHVEAEWTESGSTWNIKFHYVNAGGARTQLGGSFNFGDALDATQFTTWIDTRSTANFATTLDGLYPDNWYQKGVSISAHPFIAITSASAGAGPGGERVAVIGIRYLDDISGNPFLDDTTYDVWNVASGSLATGTAWHTAIDENDQSNRPNTDDEGDNLDSTCIFDDAGTMSLLGSQGGSPQSQIPIAGGDDGEPGAGECSTAIVCTNTANVPEGFTIGTFNALLGMFLIAGISGGAYFTLGKSAIVAGAFALVGLIIAVVIGLIPLWVVLVIAVVGTAVVFIGIKKGAGG